MKNAWSQIYFGVVYLTLSAFLTVRGKIQHHPEVDLSFEERVKRHGYPLEIHQVTTEDDYILSLYNIPHGLQKPNNHNNQSKSVALILHGMGGAPSNFIALGRKKGVAYYLADRDFDVWLLCARGNEGSFKEKHKRFDWEKDKAYWLFSYHEIAIYDLAATIDFILNKTTQEKLFIIGHSAGGAAYLSLLSEKPEYNDKIKMAVSWGSSPVLKRADYPVIALMCSLVDFWKGLFKYLNIWELFPIWQTLRPFLREMCADPKWQKVCLSLSGIIGSHRSVLQDPNMIEVLFIDQPPRLASQLVFHFMENFNSGEFRKYDHGAKKNMKLYGEKYPPLYNLSNCQIPLVLFIGTNDDIIVKEDIYEAIEQLPNARAVAYEVLFHKFTHTDFVAANNASELVYEPTYRFLKNYDEGILP